jgi:PD-(D/E)XK endonuclease
MRKREAAFRRRRPRLAQAPSAPPPRQKTPFDRELTTKRRGEISELAFALAAARRGFGISKPFGDSNRYDIILDCQDHDCRDRDRQDDNCRDSDCRDSNGRRNHARQHLNAQTRPRLIRVQVKSSTQLLNGLYHLNAHRRINGRAVPYKLSEIDFIAAYVIPEDSWFIFPLPHILGLTSLLLSPKHRRHPSLYDSYREAWHHLREPDGLIFA